MTPQVSMVGGETNEPEEEPDAVRVDTESASGPEVTTTADDTTAATENDTADSERGEDISAESEDGKDGAPAKARRAISFSRLLAFGALPFLVLSLAVAGGYLKWQSSSIRAAQAAGIESVAAARDATIAMLSYQPDSVEKDLGSARDRMTGTFKDSYTQLTHDVVIPGAKQRHISAVATVPAAASVSATADHAVALVFVNQTVVVGSDAPSATASSVRVTLDKLGGRWLISGFDPV